MTEPEAPKGWPACPKYLDKIAKEEWTSICQQLDSMQLLSTADRQTLELYCLSYSRFRRAEAETRSKEGEVWAAESGYQQATGWATRLDKHLETCRKMLIEMGLTPAARARMERPAAQVSSEKWAGILTVVGGTDKAAG